MTTSQHPLALKPLYFPALNPLNPAEHYNGGIPIRAVEDDLQGIIPAWFNMNIGDKAEVFWGNANSAVWTKTLDLDSELNKDLSFTIAKAHVLEGETKPVFYRITYKNQTKEDSKPELVLLVKLTRPGGYDDIPGDDGHSDLNFALDYDDVDQNLPAKGVTMRIVPYRNLTRYDRILARWGSQQVAHVVTPQQAQDPVGHPIDVVFSRAVIEAAGDGPEVAVAYQVVDRCGNYPDERAPWSAIRKVLVDLGGNRLNVPLVLVKGQPTNSMNLDQLGDDDVEVLVNTPAADFKVGDKVFLTWTGTPAQGSQIIVGPLELPVDFVDLPLKFSIPNASVRAIAKGSASVGYVCKRSGAADRPSKNASVTVIGEISQLRAPTVDEAPGGNLPPETLWATVNIPWYPGRNSSDLINLIWQAQAPGGSTVYYEDPRPVGNVAENQPVLRSVSNAEIQRFNGLNVKVFYIVTNSETALLSVRESLVFPMQVGVPLPTFARPEVEGADNGALDPDKVPPTGATLVMPYLGTRDKDRVTWRWRGSASGGSTSDHVDLIPATAGKAVRITVAKQYVTANLNGTVVADYSIQRAGVTLGNSHELTLRIGAALDLEAPKIKEANGTSLNPFAAKDSLTAIVDYTGMALGDDIIVTWTGTTPNGSDTSAKTPVTTLGPQSIPLKNAVVAFNLGKAVTVIYTVTRGGAPVPSKELPLTVLAIPHEHAELPKATIDGASNDDLDVITLANNAFTRVATWPLIAANQKIWLRYTGIKADGSEYKKATYEGVPLLGNGVIVGPYPATPVAELRGLKDNSKLEIEFKVTFDGSTDEAKAVTFPPRVYNVKAVEDVRPVISTVTDSKGEDIPHNGGTVDPKIKLTGKAAPLQEVEVFEGTTPKGKRPVDADGVWTYETTLAGIATRTFTATAQYGTGQTSLGRTFTFSNAVKPAITSVKDSKGVEIPDKGTTLDTTVKLTGNATPRLKVEIFDGGSTKGTANVGANGIWEREVTGLSLAAHSFTAKALYVPGESSVARTLTVGMATPIKPSIKEAAGSNLNPIAAKDRLTVVVPHYTGMDGNDRLTVTWTGAPNTLPAGSHTSTAVPVGTVGQKEITIPNTVVAFNLGKAVKVLYTVTRNSVPTKSAEFDLNVQAIPNGHAELTKPTIDGAPNDELDVTTLATNALTRVAPWPLIAANQKIWLRYVGTNANGSEYKKSTYEGAPLVGSGVIQGPYPATPVADLRGLKNNTTLNIEFKVTFDGSTDETKALTFPLRKYAVKTVYPDLIVDTSPVRLAGTNVVFPGGAPLHWHVKPGQPVGTTANRKARGGVPPYTYVSSHPHIASVSADGIISSVKNGTATITVSDQVSQSKTIQVTSTNVLQFSYNPTPITYDEFRAWFRAVGGQPVEQSLMLQHINAIAGIFTVAPLGDRIDYWYAPVDSEAFVLYWVASQGAFGWFRGSYISRWTALAFIGGGPN